MFGRPSSVRVRLRLAALDRTTPISDHWGSDRGSPVDRYYIESFLSDHRRDIRGRVLEIKDRRYTSRYGSGVERADVLDIDTANNGATIIADLADAPGIPDGSFDCIVLTQTLQFVFPIAAAVATLHRILAAGGVVLATIPTVSKIDRHAGVDGDYWRLTPAAARRLFSDVFHDTGVTTQAYGNVMSAVAFLHGLSCEDVRREHLDKHDPLFPVIVGVRAQRS